MYRLKNNQTLWLMVGVVIITGVNFADTSVICRIEKKYALSQCALWAENVPGVKTKLVTNEKVLALTLDVCGSVGDGCDYRYVDFLKQEDIPATIFVSSKWIQRHPGDFQKLSECPLFEIANHGLNHVPASINGNLIYGIQGTKNIAELIYEVEMNALIIQGCSGKKPKFYRSGTAYYDEIATKIVNELGYDVIGFDILGDAGATYSADQVERALLKSKPGSIIILHMNKPQKDCALGAIKAIKQLKVQGFRFVKLSDYSLE